MKVYVLGDEHSHALRLTNFINSVGNTAIMSERVSSDYNELVEDALRSKDFDLMVAISKRPVETCIEANRDDRLRAAVCKDRKEASMARKAHANMAILDGNNLDDQDAENIVEALLKSPGQSGLSAEEEEHSKSQRRIGGIGSSLFSPSEQHAAHNKKKEEPAKESREEKKEEREEEHEDEIPKPRGKGLINSIKDMFGIE